VEVVVPRHVEPAASLLLGPHEVDLLRLVLGDEEDGAPARGDAAVAREIGERTCRSDASKIPCVASIRSPSRWNSEIQ
jgi:hypothetical protein